MRAGKIKFPSNGSLEWQLTQSNANSTEKKWLGLRKSAHDLKDHLRQAKRQKVVGRSMATKAQAHSVN